MQEILKQNVSSIEREPGRELVPMFSPISKEKADHLLKQLSDDVKFNFNVLKISVVSPGDPLFDLQEAQTKLYLKAGGVSEYKQMLARHGLTWPIKSRRPDIALRDVAKSEGVLLDDSFAGFAYNIGGSHIMYPAIREDQLLQMANKYAKKEKEEIEFTEPNRAKEYLANLAEKYFYHEVGHFVYMHALQGEQRDDWDSHVLENSRLHDRVVEVQIDKHPTKESIPVANEAFADIFSEVVTHGKMSNRLGSWPDAVALAKDLLEEIGFKI